MYFRITQACPKRLWLCTVRGGLGLVLCGAALGYGLGKARHLSQGGGKRIAGTVTGLGNRGRFKDWLEYFPASSATTFGGGAFGENAERLRFESDLRRAVEREELTLHYQPQVNLETGKVTGLEALLRWECPKRGTVHPDEFIALVEESGLIFPIGLWVLKEACCSAVRNLQSTGGRRTFVGVNLSAKQFKEPELADEISAIIGETGIAPEALVLEITESLPLEDTPQVAETLRRIQSLGVKLALDDFGTGYSSLSYLERLPADYLKIDRSFILRLDGEKEDGVVILSAILDAAETLGIETVAEGIEMAAQADRLKGLRCKMGQGYYFSEPLPEEEAYKLVGASLPVRGPEREIRHEREERGS